MRLINFIVPVAMIATLALFAPDADAQTMGEYATTVGVASGDSSLGSDSSGSSRTWGASSLGASFDERAGAASGSGTGSSFDSRAGGSGSGSTSESRWPSSSGFASGEGADRFGSSDRFQASDRFTARTDLSASSSRFPESQFNDNRMGLDTHYNSVNGN